MSPGNPKNVLPDDASLSPRVTRPCHRGRHALVTEGDKKCSSARPAARYKKRSPCHQKDRHGLLDKIVFGAVGIIGVLRIL